MHCIIYMYDSYYIVFLADHTYVTVELIARVVVCLSLCYRYIVAKW